MVVAVERQQIARKAEKREQLNSFSPLNFGIVSGCFKKQGFQDNQSAEQESVLHLSFAKFLSVPQWGSSLSTRNLPSIVFVVTEMRVPVDAV